ncbi:MAG: tRNA uridine 5-carboxymethylaminomethyl modification enzyme MnmG [candidate division TM6 bacterium GW2011_GWE2_42_60]|nr:MAG: tRNA uridine 5-carboxymethylaminomethyl modification enzyme MnmG [candidate division TM6 bacterium GW2011_GWE2_42_60]HBY05530.1 tRNA uridine-5-carboxymethylaminomethyl(34) synthesis enzyme MnmG [Candidatus Dependentiae bacterium]
MHVLEKTPLFFDTIVIGGGHAGVEAAAAAARMGVSTALITLRADRIGFMPCNPSIGGIGKGHIVFEISALGGLMPKLCTQSYLQAKMLNTSKGPAVQGLRLQIDKHLYAQCAQKALASIPHLSIIEAMVDELLCSEQKRIEGVRLADGRILHCSTVIVTGGTFLNGIVHIGEESYPAGRSDEPSIINLAASMKQLGIRMGRMKTGTPARLLRSSVDVSCMERDIAEPLDYLYEFHPHHAVTKEECFITHTNAETHRIILESAQRSPIFSKRITGTPTRYCPAIEDKLVRFSHKDAHHVFVEPEGLDSEELYPNGISNSLPKDIQERFIQSIKGFEKAVITRYAYGIEYDFVHPEQLSHTLELKTCPGLFFAGQINGTTGYEEAAGQGLIAGINAALAVKKEPPYSMSRNEGYIGIMIDDLVSMGVDEPYRMFTSRAERRLILRQDNVFARLSGKAFALGLISNELFTEIDAEINKVQATLDFMQAQDKYKTFAQLISNNYPERVKQEIKRLSPHALSPRALETVYAEILYAPYKKRELKEVEKNEAYRALSIPSDLVYQGMPGLSHELKEKLIRLAPKTIAQAALIQGMTPATISLLIFRVREHTAQKRS